MKNQGEVNYFEAPLYRTPILLKGYHPQHNAAKDYKTAKQPCVTGFTLPDYEPPTPEDVKSWTAAGGWVGHLVPEGHHVIDAEDPHKIMMIRAANSLRGLKPPVNKTNNGLQFCYRTNGGQPFTGDSNRRTRLGFRVTDRAAGRNYVINPPNNGRTWENPEALFDPPVLPDELERSRNNLEDTINELAWALGELHRAGDVAGFEDLDAGFMDLLVGCGLPEKKVMDAFRLLFLDKYSERRTFDMLVRTVERKKSGVPMQGAGTLIKRLKDIGQDKIISIIERLERLTGKSKGKRAKTESKTILTAYLPGLVDLVIDEGAPAFLMLKDGKLELHHSFEDVSPDGAKVITQPPGSEHLPFPLVPADAVIRHFADADEGLFDEVLDHLKQYAYLTDEQWLICAVYVFASYLHEHPDIQYIGILFFYAVPERGKTRTGKALTYVSYRGVHCVDLRETNLFRYSQELRATLFLDIMDLWKKAERNQSEDVLLLRYEKGATVARVLYPEKGAFKDTKYYRVYGPTVMASNQPVHKILDTRCLTFQMPNRPGRYINPSPEKALPLRAKLTAWRARHMDGPLPEVAPIDGIQGRLWDITQPLFQVCKLVAPERLDALVEAVLNIATDRTEEKQSSDDGQLVQVLIEMSPSGLAEWDILTGDITDIFNKDRPADWQKNVRTIARRLRALGVKTKLVSGKSRTFLNTEVITTLADQYGYLTRPETHETHDNTQPSENYNYSTHELQNELLLEKRNSCTNSCSQDAENINKSDLHEFHESICTQEDEVIEVTDVEGAEVQG